MNGVLLLCIVDVPLCDKVVYTYVEKIPRSEHVKHVEEQLAYGRVVFCHYPYNN